jgi:hypothetical protein
LVEGGVGDFVVGEEGVDEFDEGVVEGFDGAAQCGGGLGVCGGFVVVGVDDGLGFEDEVGEAGEGGGGATWWRVGFRGSVR